MADLGNLHFGVHLVDYTDAEADKIKKKLENLSISLNIDGKNVNISHTDLIKKQIEDAIKSVSVQSVNVDANAVKAQVNTALQGLNPSVSVTLLKGTLGNDLQAYLNTKTFNISVSVTQGSALNAVRTAFANVSVPVNVSVSSRAVIQQLNQSLANSKVKVGIEAKDPQDLINDIKAKLKNRKITVDIEADRNTLIQSIKQSLQGNLIKAYVNVSVDAQAITKAVQNAINNASFTYSPNGKGGNANSAANAQRNLGNAYYHAARGAFESARASVTLGGSLRTNIRLAGELGTAMGNFASVFGIKDLLQNMVRIGGELENQRIALGAILQDGGKATEMFSKIQSLAVKSPFGIMDLNQYTKQLSAYGIAYNEVYDTMKRLADISAGVGVNMGRIILAYGQVRAAGFLKGTELRQFTEANIPMVEKLAERFSNLEKRIVSAGEVYDMISKKKVTFEDVKSVLWDLTGEGGMFNNMQEVLSESLASKWKNLSDAIDVMYGKLADGAIGGGLKNIAEWLTELTKNWEYLTAAINSAATAYAAFKIGSVLGGASFAGTKNIYNDFMTGKQKEANALRLASTYRELTRAEERLIQTTGRLTIADTKRLIKMGALNKEEALRLISMKKLDAQTEAYVARLYQLDAQMLATAKSSTWFNRALVTLGNGFRTLGTALKGLFASPWTWVTLAVTAIAEVFTYYSKKQDEIEERNKNFAESAKGSAETLERELLKIKDLDISKMNTDEMKIKVKELTTVIQNEADGWQSILSEIFAKEADGTFKNSVEEQLKLLKTKMDELAEAKKELMGDDEMYSDVIGSTETGMLWWEEDVLDKIKDYNELVKDNDKYLKQLGVHARDVSDALSYAVGDNEAVTEELSGKSLNEQVALLSEYSDEWQKFIRRLSDTNSKAMNIANVWKANVPSKREIEKAFETAKEAMDNAFALKGEDINNFTERGRQAVYGFVDGVITETATQKKKMQQWMYDWWTGKYNIPRNDLDYIVPPQITDINSGGNTGGSEKDAVAEMWKKRAEEIDKAVKMYDKWKKIEGKLMAENRVKYHDELSNLFNGAYGFNLDLEDPTEAYEYIQSLLDSSKEKQKELKISLGVKLEDAAYNDAKKEFDEFVNEMKAYAKKTTEQWNLYKQLFEATGDKKFAQSAFDNTQVWDDAAKSMRAELEKKMEEQGRMFELDFTISDKSAKEAFEGKDGLYELWKQIKDRIEKNGIDLKVNTAKAIESVQSVQDKIKSKESQRDEELKLYHEGTPEYDAVAKKWENEITQLKGELFELQPAFKELFVDTTGMASGKLFELWKKAKSLVDLIRQNTTKTVKNANGEVIGRYYTDAEGQEQYVSEQSLKDVEGVVSKTGKKVSQTQLAFDRLWDSIRGKGDEGYKFVDIATDISVLADATAQASQELSSMFDSLGNEDLADSFAFAGEMLNGVSTLGKAAASFASGDILGGIYGGISGVTGIISSIAGMHDKKLDRAIKKSQLEVQKLQNAYSQLETQLERQLGSATAGQAAKMLDSLREQRTELLEQYELEDEKKKTDKSKLEDYKNQIAELDDQIKYFYEDLASEQYGVDIKGWASQIADALTEAFATGEDAAKAFDNTVSDILRSLATEAIRMQFIEPAMNNLRDYMFGDNGIFTHNSESGTDLSANEAAGLGVELEKLKGQIEASNEYWDKINEAVGGILTETESSSSGLSKGIEGVTEDTANLLGSYLQAIRQDVSVKRSLIEKLIAEDVPQMNYLAQAQLVQLQSIAANTLRNANAADKIYDLVNRVVDKGSNKLKV